MAIDPNDEEDTDGSDVLETIGGFFNKLNSDVLLDDLSFSCTGSASGALELAMAAYIGTALTCFVIITSSTCVIPPATVVSLLCSLVVVVPLMRD